MSSSIIREKCRLIRGWERVFLHHLELGSPEQNARARAGVGQAMVKQKTEKDPVFAEQYEAAKATGAARKRPYSGGFV